MKLKEIFKKLSPKEREPGQIDLKWIAAISATLIFTIILLLSNVLSVISKNNIIDTMTSKVNNSVNQKIEEITTVSESISYALDKDVKINILNAAQQNFHQREVLAQTKIDQINASQEEKSAGFFSAQEKEKYLKKFELFLNQRAQTSIELAKNQESSPSFGENGQYFELKIPKVYSPNLYHKYLAYYILAIILFIVFFLAALYYSAGFGRLITAGLIFMFSTVFGLKIFSNINSILNNSFLKNATDANSGLIRAFFTPIYDVIHDQIVHLYRGYEVWMIIGVTLLVLGIIGKIIQHYNPKFLK